MRKQEQLEDYINDLEEFTINAGLIIQKKPVAGLIYAPAKDRMFYSYGDDLSFELINGEPIKLDNSKNFYKLLFKFGYKPTNNSLKKIRIYKNFQRRFRPQLISSIVDQESYEILKSLI